MECKRNPFLKIQYFISENLLFWKYWKFWLTGSWYILRWQDLRLYRVVFAFLRRRAYVWVCVYTLHHVRLPYSCDKWGKGEGVGDTLKTYLRGAAVWTYAWCTLLSLQTGGWVGWGLQKYRDILCNYICGIALCWQSQSEVLKCILRYCFVMT